MAVDHIRYDILAQDALRGLVRKVLMDTAKNGLPGEHHFYISFDTPFGGIPERVAVPFAAVKGFFDPSVQFGLQFEEVVDGGLEESGQAGQNAAAGSTRDATRSEKHTAIAPAVPVAANPEPAKTTTDAQDDKPAGGEVVRLDRFRKK